LIYLAFVFLGAALMAPPIYKLSQGAARQSPFLHSTFQTLSRQPFHRYVNRCLIALALVGLWPFLRSLGIRQWKDLGFAPLRLHWKKAVAGFFTGFCSLAILAALSILSKTRTLDLSQSGGALAGNLFGALLTGIVVALLEETLFRGALFGTLRNGQPWKRALFISSMVYALVHFFAKAAPPTSVNWLSGFVTLGEMLRGFADFQTLVPGFFNLLLVGSILALMFQLTGNLYFPIGLHAGWIFWLKSYGLLTNRVSGTNLWLWGGAKMIDGWLATTILFVTLALLFRFYPKPIPNSHAAQ
ncbi:MAG: CPBP family intramembrane glutamic endopeptidase, partial [Verrucomicrobiota bacterium]